MSIKQILKDEYLKKADEKAKVSFINDINSFLLETNFKRDEHISALTAECDYLQNKVSRAKLLIDEAIEETAKAKKTATNTTKHELQTTRDRLVAIGVTANLLGVQINESNGSKLMITTLNNIIANVGIITNELISLGLWDSNEIKPTLIKVKYIETVSKKM